MGSQLKELEEPKPDVIIFGEPCWSIETVAKQLRVQKSTLSMWRSQGKGPEFRKVGKDVLYPVPSTKRWYRER